jgi:pimeloyl-ACP methyl ester carboxylesterase
VYAWAHGTAGLGDQCAPSKAIRENLPPYAGEVSGGNALVVATDYEGLGTPGDHTYLAGRPEGQAVLDAVRAARALPGAGPIGGVVLAGQSQGGGAALFAAQLAPTYAPELRIRGVLAGAPAAELGRVASVDRASPYKGLLLLAAAGLHSAYPDFDPSSFLTASADADLTRVRSECVDATISRYQHLPARDVVTADPSSVAAVRRILDENSPGATNPNTPIMIVQGENDEQIPVAVSAALAAKYCSRKATVVRRIYAGASHDGVLDAAHDDAVAWINARLEGRPAPSNCG